MPRFYGVPFENVTISVAQDLFEITPAANKKCAIIGLFLGNVGGAADAGDAQEEMLRLIISRGYTTSGSGGTAPTPSPLDSSDPAAGFSAEVNNTTLATTGTIVSPVTLDWNVRQGLREMWPEEMWVKFTAADTRAVVRLLSTPADALSVSGTLFVAEL